MCFKEQFNFLPFSLTPTSSRGRWQLSGFALGFFFVFFHSPTKELALVTATPSLFRCPVNFVPSNAKRFEMLNSFLNFPSSSPPPDQHPLPPERPVQPPVPALHRGHPVHRREPGALQPQAHAEPSPEAAALPRCVHQSPRRPEIRLIVQACSPLSPWLDSIRALMGAWSLPFSLAATILYAWISWLNANVFIRVWDTVSWFPF